MTICACNFMSPLLLNPAMLNYGLLDKHVNILPGMLQKRLYMLFCHQGWTTEIHCCMDYLTHKYKDCNGYKNTAARIRTHTKKCEHISPVI